MPLYTPYLMLQLYISNPPQKDCVQSMKTLIMTLMLLGLCAINVFGFGSQSGRQDGPPQEAFTACEGKNAGDPAEFVNNQGETVEGLCKQQGDQLVLRPTNFVKKSSGQQNSRGMSGNRNGGRQQGPPKEAYTACEGKNAGDTAEFTSPRGDTVEGICEQHGSILVLRPNNPPQ